MDEYIISILIVGAVTFLMAWMPLISDKTQVSYSVYYVVIGVLIYTFFPKHLPNPLPQENGTAVLHLAELIVIISLMGAGIKIEKPFSFKKWNLPLKLVFIAMLLCIAAAVTWGYFLLGFNLAGAVLLGAALAPTDPVLASDVQVSPPNEKIDSEHKFTLTSEAGINDGLAFPFTWLAITIALISAGKDTSYFYWFSFHLVYQIVAGIALGYIFGKGAGYVVFDLSKNKKFANFLDGFLAVSLTLLVYGVTELLHGYGFISVFVCATTFRHYEKEHKYHSTMHSFTDQIERIFVAILLILFGGSLAMGILDHLTWQMILFSLAFLLVIRPLFAYLSLSGSKIDIKEKLGISFFGIRGMGSIFYLAFAFNEIGFDSENQLWSIVVFTIALSIFIHGLTATPAMRYLNKKLPKPEK